MALRQRRAEDLNLESMFVRMSIRDEGERRRLHAALMLAVSLIERHFADRVDAIVVLYRSYDASERMLPLEVQAPFEGDEGYYLLEKDLGDKVLGPVFRETRVTLPLTIAHAIDRPTSGVGLIFVAEG